MSQMLRFENRGKLDDLGIEIDANILQPETEKVPFAPDLCVIETLYMINYFRFGERYVFFCGTDTSIEKKSIIEFHQALNNQSIKTT